ncbi:MAG TPA: homoserine dehydrogenase [Clostridia bacterium]|nr:homoserine dehydrogenase [Clostridiaceae bacterium]HOA30787.1 homoserine dehydrogenase [Clostridia bacterium]HPZ53007.1 homoserine dehydrogenase [Clostridia bacterium]
MVKIAIMGCGVVGSGVADILLEKSEELSRKFNKKVKLARILDIRDMKGTPYEPYLTKNADEILNDPKINIMVMTIGGEDIAYTLTKKALEAGKHVVTSNKEIVAAFGRELVETAYNNNVRFMYEASAGGGIPIIRPLNICLASNDIYEIQGILNGTTNYILTKMHRDKMTFEEALAKAQQKGYAEADPTADVDGHDAARKIAILSSVAYDKFVDYRDVSCTGIRNICYEDLELSSANGFKIKLIARSINKDGKIEAVVEPLLLGEDHMLAKVDSVFNGVLVKGSYTGDSMFYGKGAGKLPTASAILGDIIEILTGSVEKSLPGFVKEKAEMTTSKQDSFRFFVRIWKNSISSEEMAKVVENSFGKVAIYCGESENNREKAALITGYLSREELDKKIEELTQSLNIKVENVIKVED